MPLLLFLLALFSASAAEAHRSAPFDPGDGIRIESLTHGQMAVLDRHRNEILALADRHYPPDDALRRLVNYARLQRTWCLWGMMPGTVTDEASPFNICAHAYLAATRAVLLRLSDLPAPPPGTVALRQRVDDDMLLGGASLVLCAYSEEPFSTAALIRPDWSMLRDHRPSLAAFGAAGALILGGLWALLPRRRA